MATQTLTIKLGMTGLQGIQDGFRRIKLGASEATTGISQAFAPLNRQAEGINKVRGLLNQFSAEGSSGISKLAGNVSALGQTLGSLRGALTGLSLGGVGAFAALSKSAEMFFEGVADRSESLKSSLANVFTPGRDLASRARGVSSIEERDKVRNELGAEIDRLRKRREQLAPAARNPLGSDWENANRELTEILNQMSNLGALRDKLSGTAGEEIVRANQLAQANKEASTWLKANADSTERQIETMRLGLAPMETQLRLLTEQRNSLRELYGNTPGGDPMGEKARLEIKRDELSLEQQIAQVSRQIAQERERDAAEERRQTQEIGRLWTDQIRTLNQVGEELRRNERVRLGIETNLREQTRGMTYAGNAADNYGQFTLAGMSEQANGSGGFGAGAIAGIQNSVAMLGTTASQVGNAIQTTIGGALDGISSSIEGLIRGTMRWADAFKNVGLSILNSVVTAFSQMLAQMAVSFALQKVFGSAMRVQAMQLGSAWSTAAISASIATYGTAAGVGLGAFLSAQAAGQAASIGMNAATGFRSGGYTGDVGVDQVAGVVHGREYVFDAPTVERIGLPKLEAIQSGADPAAVMGGGGAVNIAAFDSRMDARRWAETQDAETWFVDMAARTSHRWQR